MLLITGELNSLWYVLGFDAAERWCEVTHPMGGAQDYWYVSRDNIMTGSKDAMGKLEDY